MKEKTLKDVIENQRRNWYGESDKSQDDNCYKGLFWDHTTKTYKRWKKLLSFGYQFIKFYCIRPRKLDNKDLKSLL